MQTGHAEALTLFLDSIAVCDEATELKECFAAAAQAFGIKHVHYCRETIVGDFRGTRTHSLSTVPIDWIARFIEMDYQAEDLWTEIARTRNGPVVWSDISADMPLNDIQRQMVAEANEVGLFDGMNVPIRDGASVAHVALAVGEPGAEATETIKRNIGVLSTMAYAFHHRASAILVDDSFDFAVRGHALSPREKEVLRWIAVGKTDWEVGQVLGISERVVKFHVSGAKRKLHACNRTHAVAKAMASHVIDLG